MVEPEIDKADHDGIELVKERDGTDSIKRNLPELVGVVLGSDELMGWLTERPEGYLLVSRGGNVL